MMSLRGSLIKVTLAIFALFLVAGCSSITEKSKTKPQFKVLSESELSELTATLEESISSDKKQIKVGETFTVTAVVKYGNKDISKDTKEEFEILENDVSTGKVKPKYEGNGTYSLKMMFSSKGHHQVAAHAYYKGFHEMKILSFNVSK